MVTTTIIIITLIIRCWPLATAYALGLHDSLLGQTVCLPTDKLPGVGRSATLQYAAWILESDAAVCGMEVFGVAPTPAAARQMMLDTTLAFECNPASAASQDAGTRSSDSGGTTTTVITEGSRELNTTIIAVLAVVLVVLMACAGAIAHSSSRRLLRLQTQLAKRIEPEQLVIISDPGTNLDDEVAMIMARFLEHNRYIKLHAVIANLRPEKERARLMRGTLDLLGMQHVPVGIGTDGGSLAHTDLFSETAPYLPPLDSSRMVALEPGRALVLTPDTAHNNTFDFVTSTFFHRRCHQVVHSFLYYYCRCSSFR
ncbi:hypothetical protein T492DRAFT_348246 [Pavlovales sp. CCMP2436]|nr:hypothetical protein T492DRAFT_348246 [Pavlovales sp. CCMP2436]